MTTSPRIWRFGDAIDTDAMAPGQYMKDDLATLASHCLESVRPEFPQAVSPGDIVVAGSNFGLGSSREQAPQALRHLGVSLLVARSYAGLFFRNAINLGLAAVVCPDVDRLPDGVAVRVDHAAGLLELDGGERIAFQPMPDFLRAIVDAGGLMPHLQHTFARKPA